MLNRWSEADSVLDGKSLKCAQSLVQNAHPTDLSLNGLEGQS